MLVYDELEFKSFFWKGKLKEAMAYLREIPNQQALYERYVDVFVKKIPVVRSENKRINEIDQIYQDYYRDVFWHELPLEEANTKLYNALEDICDFNPEKDKDKDIEDEVAKLVAGEGYEFLGGDTQGILGPYIWKESNEVIYEVDLPSGREPYKVIMLDGFVSRSWMDFISFGLTGTGGWVNNDGTLCCVKKCYDTESESFKISFLKHEAQHAYDKRTRPDMSSEELEYRAKLVELIYWHDEERILAFLKEADSTNSSNTHAIAAHRIVQELSEKIFNCPYQNKENAWSAHIPLVQKYARELLK